MEHHFEINLFFFKYLIARHSLYDNCMVKCRNFEIFLTTLMVKFKKKNLKIASRTQRRRQTNKIRHTNKMHYQFKS